MEERIRILLVEDDKVDQMAFKRFVAREELPYDYEIAGSVSKARVALSTGRFDVALLDYLLGDGTAFDLFDEIEDTPIVVITGSGDEEIAVRAMKAGVYDYMVKDPEGSYLTTLPVAVESAIRRKRAEKELKQYREHLEELVEERTAELTKANEQLLAEIDERVRAESRRDATLEALQESEEKYRQLFELESDSIFLIDNETGCILEVNAAGSILYGYSREELLHKKNTDLSAEPDETRKATVERWSQVPVRFHRKKDGTVFPVEITGRHFTWRGREVHIAAIRDITERARVEEERERLLARIQEQAQRVQQIVDTVPEGVLLLGADGQVILANPAAEEGLTVLADAKVGDTLTYLGDRPLAELLAPPPQGLWHEVATDGRFFEVIARPIETGPDPGGASLARTWDATAPHRQPALPAQVTATCACATGAGSPGEPVEGWVLVVRDVTQEREIERRIQQQERLAAVGQLSAGIAHDFNNLLTAINGFAELMQFELSPDDPRQDLVEKILGSGRRAADLVRQLLAFSRKQIIQPRVLDLNAVVVDMDKMLRRIISEDIELETILAPDLRSVKVDPAQIEQVIVNLVVNARDAMPDGGRLIIETANVILDEASTPFPLRGLRPSGRDFAPVEDYAADHLEAEPGKHVLLTVSDTGVGMSKEVQARIFEPFFTTKEMGKGTGLGLATVYGIVRQSGGHIWVTSEEGGGTTFKIYLPRAGEAAQPLPPPGIEREIPSGGETILLAEDDARVHDLVRYVLQRQGYTLLEAESGQEALQLAAGHSGPIHLLLTDVVMPGMSGMALAEQLTGTRPDLKVLFMSGYSDEAIAHHGVLEPDTPFIQKPFSPMALARKVRTVLDD